MSPKKETQKSAKSAGRSRNTSDVWTAEEKAALRATARERKAQARAQGDRAAGESAVRQAIAEMAEPDRSMAKRIHAIVTESAPGLWPKTWYGMPAYAKNEKVVCFFQPAQKFKARYSTFGFNDVANLDDGVMWPTAFALTRLTSVEEKRIEALVKKAAS